MHAIIVESSLKLHGRLAVVGTAYVTHEQVSADRWIAYSRPQKYEGRCEINIDMHYSTKKIGVLSILN